jgi:TatD DNase family protein
MGHEVIDTHCHLNMVEEFGIPHEVSLKQAEEAGVSEIVLIAVDQKSAEYHKSLCLSHNATSKLKLRWTAGLHPEGAHDISGVDDLLAFAAQSRSSEDFLGIGETGLDYYHSTEFVANQKESFRKHLTAAREMEVPAVVHLRDSQKFDPARTQSVADALQIVKETKARGVLHCFTYSLAEAVPFVDLGWYISFSGITTYKNAAVIQQAAAGLPLDCILVETDAPFLTPNPVRGQTNQPAFVAHTLDFICKLRRDECGDDPSHTRTQILHNTRRFFSLKKQR